MSALHDTRAAVLAYLQGGASPVKGAKLERFFHELLCELPGTADVVRQRAGLQFGRDFSFSRAAKLYYAECKNYDRDLTPSDLSEKLLWLPLLKPSDYYAIVSPTPLDNAIREYLLGNQHSSVFLDWAGENFFLLCTQAPITVKKFCGHTVGQLSPEELRRARDVVECRSGVYPPNRAVGTQVVHQLGSPHMWVFYRSERGVERTILLREARFRVHVTNLAADAATIDLLSCTVERVADVPKRMLGWHKMKGLIKPPRFEVDLSSGARALPDLLNGSVLKVTGHDQEVFDVDFVGPTDEGFFRAQLTARCVTRTGESELKFDPIPFLCVDEGRSRPDFLPVQGLGRLDLAAGHMLDLPEVEWQRCLAAGAASASSRYLGPASTAGGTWRFKGTGVEFTFEVEQRA